MDTDEPAGRTPDATPRVLEVMSEPIRWRTYVALRAFGPRKARSLAKWMRVGEASMMIHLDTMSKIGFVRADDPDKPPMQRIWQHVPGGIRLTEEVGVPCPARGRKRRFISDPNEDRSLMHRWMQVYLLAGHQFMRDWAAEESEWPTEWSPASMNQDYWYRLTADELEELTNELEEVLTGAKWAAKMIERRRAMDDGSEAVYAHINVIPVRAPRRTTD